MKADASLQVWKEALEVVLEEALKSAREFIAQAEKLRNLDPADLEYEGRHGELAAAAFLLKLKADAVHETLERLIEAEPEE